MSGEENVRADKLVQSVGGQRLPKESGGVHYSQMLTAKIFAFIDFQSKIVKICDEPLHALAAVPPDGLAADAPPDGRDVGSPVDSVEVESR